MAKQDVSAVVWNRSRDSGVTRQAAQIARNRTAGVIQGLVGAAVGALIYLFWHRVAAYVVFSIAGLVLLSALLSPGLVYVKIRIGVEKFASFVGIVVTWMALLPIFYLFFTPFHFLFRRGRRDAMARTLDKESDSYWHVREGDAPSVASYERQF